MLMVTLSSGELDNMLLSYMFYYRCCSLISTLYMGWVRHYKVLSEAVKPEHIKLLILLSIYLSHSRSTKKYPLYESLWRHGKYPYWHHIKVAISILILTSSCSAIIVT